MFIDESFLVFNLVPSVGISTDSVEIYLQIVFDLILEFTIQLENILLKICFSNLLFFDYEKNTPEVRRHGVLDWRVLGDEILKERSPVLGADRVGPLAALLVLQRLREVQRVESLDPVPRVGKENLAALDRERGRIALATFVVEDIEAGGGRVRMVVAVGEDGDILRAGPDSSQQADEDTDRHLLTDEFHRTLRLPRSGHEEVGEHDVEVRIRGRLFVRHFLGGEVFGLLRLIVGTVRIEVAELAIESGRGLLVV